MVVQAALANVGIAHVGVHLALPHLRSGELKLVLHPFHHPGAYEMVLIYPHRGLMAPRVRATLDYLDEAFSADKTLHAPLGSLSENRAHGTV
jgi:DNA-binding transcriptional LysR family regulator